MYQAKQHSAMRAQWVLHFFCAKKHERSRRENELNVKSRGTKPFGSITIDPSMKLLIEALMKSLTKLLTVLCTRFLMEKS
jgi:hypothetical protein